MTAWISCRPTTKDECRLIPYLKNIKGKRKQLLTKLTQRSVGVSGHWVGTGKPPGANDVEWPRRVSGPDGAADGVGGWEGREWLGLLRSRHKNNTLSVAPQSEETSLFP